MTPHNYLLDTFSCDCSRQKGIIMSKEDKVKVGDHCWLMPDWLPRTPPLTLSAGVSGCRSRTDGRIFTMVQSCTRLAAFHYCAFAYLSIYLFIYLCGSINSPRALFVVDTWLAGRISHLSTYFTLLNCEKAAIVTQPRVCVIKKKWAAYGGDVSPPCFSSAGLRASWIWERCQEKSVFAHALLLPY